MEENKFEIKMSAANLNIMVQQYFYIDVSGESFFARIKFLLDFIFKGKARIRIC